MSALQDLLGKYPGTEVVPVVQELDNEAFAARQLSHERLQTEGSAIGIVWLDPFSVVLASRTGLHPGWALPGGKVEPGEPFDTACLREVEEETSVRATIGRLAVIENKLLTSPAGLVLSLVVATFEAHALPGQTPRLTDNAKEEGLANVQAFSIYRLPTHMAFQDRTKLVAAITRRHALPERLAL